jgi:4-carboxymuconolactone decarboxylase
MAQLPYVGDADASPEQLAVLAEVLAERGQVSGFARSLVHSPSALRAYEALSRKVRTETPLSAELREVVILRMAQRYANEYEWRRHCAAALRIGLPEAKLAALTAWRTSDAFDERERCALALVEDCADRLRPDAATLAAATAAFAPDELIEVLMLIGFYALVAALMIPLGLIDDDGHAPAPVPMGSAERVRVSPRRA